MTSRTGRSSQPAKSLSDRRRWDRTPLDEQRLFVELRLPTGWTIDGLLVDLSPVGMRVEVDDPAAEQALRRSRIAHVTVRSTKQVIYEADAMVVHVSAMPAGGVAVGLNLIEDRRVSEPPRNLGDRRAYERIACELPGTLLDGSGEGPSPLPVVLTDISETGCRISGVPANSHPRLGALVELAIHPPVGSPVRVACRVVSPYSDRDCGVRFVGAMDPELHAMVAALRYPDLVMATPDQAQGLWGVLSAAGYLRERETQRYFALREAVVACWSRLSAPEASALNRSVVSTDARGLARSITQVTRFYPHAWLGHHLAAAGDKMFRRRVVPQHHGNVHDTVEALGAKFFLVYYNASHKAQTGIYSTLREQYPQGEMALNDWACFDVDVETTSAAGAAAQHDIRQVSPAYSRELVACVRRIRDDVSFRALSIDEDLELSGLEREYERLGLMRRRTWYALLGPSGIAAAASVDLAPPGFNLTSIGNHATLYVPDDVDADLETMNRLRALMHYVGDAFRQRGRRYFLLLAPPRFTDTLRGFKHAYLAPGQEFVVGAGMFRTLNSFINETYRDRVPASERRRASGDPA